MIRDEATENQFIAADPGASTWLGANAGSGKTRVLTDRVARLLLRGTDPSNILCLTYTKAAAAEMQNRLFRRLGEWAMLPDADLRAALADLGEAAPAGAEGLAHARVLFAQAMEAPGGLRIQTIHAFCAGLLRRFPLEAGVNPQFQEMDDRAGQMLRAEIADLMAAGPERGLVDAMLRHAGAEIDPLLAEIAGLPEVFSRDFDEAEMRATLDAPAAGDIDGLVADLMAPAELALVRRVAALCAAGGANDQKAAVKLAKVCGRPADLEILEDVLLTGASAKEPFSAKAGKFPTKATREADPEAMADLDELMERVAAARPARLGLAALDRARALHDFGRAFTRHYLTAKSRRGLLDFDDLIARARELLDSREVAQWVLFKLDGGIDHILVDEAQDTSPDQWAVIRGLTQEFASGEGARGDLERTIFVVGDQKQSIYSFQGADPAQFDEMRDLFDAELTQIGRRVARRTLKHSFRSSPAILRAVDEVFQGPHLQGLGSDPVLHSAFFDRMPGRVDLWPAVPPPEKSEEEEPHWADPVDRQGKRHPNRVLAEVLAKRIRQMVDHEGLAVRPGEPPRKITEGDILILVQRRSDLFTGIIRELKAEGLRVAGADRLRIGAELAVRDIGATLRFLSLAEDDLSLAAALRSPLFGWDEARLYALAAHRPERQSLWEALRRAAPDDTLPILDDLRRQADFLRPYDLINRLLLRHDGRRRLIARLGAEAEDGIDALLSQALAFERMGPPHLTGFVEWMQTDETDLKRQMESRGDAIRVMTVHGSKGLEAPIVILPDTAKRSPRDRGGILPAPGGAIWAVASAGASAAQTAIREAARRKDEEERRRLLYVAMTRAESWLITAGAGETGAGGDSWHATIAEGLLRAGAVDHDHATGPGLRLETGDWGGAPVATKQSLSAVVEPVQADFPALDGPPPELPQPVAPTDLGGAKILPGDSDPEAGDAARARGRLLHRLLEHLPRSDPAARAALAGAIVGEENEELAVAGLAMVADPALAPLLAAGLPEVAVTADLPDGRRMSGIVDLLVVEADRVLAVDYKSNRLVPGHAEATPEGILRQMGAYAHALAAIWPGRRIETAIYWTADRLLMPLPPDLVMAALRRGAPA